MPAFARSLFMMTLLCSFNVSGQVGEAFEDPGTVSTKQSTTVNSETSVPVVKAKTDDSKFSALLDVNFETNGQELNSDQKNLNSTNWLFLYYKINNDFRTRMWLSYSKSLSQNYEESFNDTRITTYYKTLNITDKLTFTPSVGAVIPTSERSSRRDGLHLGVELSPSFGYMVNEKFRVSYLPRVIKNFHEFTTSENNRVNVEYGLLQFLSMSYSFSDKIYLAPTLIYSDRWTYLGTQRDPAYVTLVELGYRYSRDLSFAIGTSTGGSVSVRENGPDQNIEIFNNNRTSYYAKFAVKF